MIAVSEADYTERALEMRAAGATDFVRKGRLDTDLIPAILAACGAA